MKTIIILAIILLASCATPQQRAEKAIAKHGSYCETLGSERDTVNWSNCIQGQIDRNMQFWAAISVSGGSSNNSFQKIQQQNQQYENNRILRNIEHQQRIQNRPSVDVRRPFTIDRLLHQ